MPDQDALNRFSDAFSKRYPIFKLMCDFDAFELKNPKQKILDINDMLPSLFD